MPTSEEIKREIVRLEAQMADESERERRREQQRLEVEKETETARWKAEQEATKRRIAAHEEQLREDALKDEEWWRERRENCYSPAEGRLGELGFCQSFLNVIRNDELQPSDWCHQCQAGWQNPNYSLVLGGARR